MAFWSTQRVRDEQQQWNLVSDFDPDRVQQGAYELTLSREVITTPSAAPRLDGIGDTLEIPPGQFAILYTEETVNIPPHVIAFISIKARYKADGLVNISGFHVDPGYHNRLKFSVYNAGNLPIFLEYGRETFLIWFSELDAATVEPYDETHRHYTQGRITPEDRQRMSQPSVSPAALNERIQKVEQKMTWLFAACGAIALGILIPTAQTWLSKSPPTNGADENVGKKETNELPPGKTHASPAPAVPQFSPAVTVQPSGADTATLTPTP